MSEELPPAEQSVGLDVQLERQTTDYLVLGYHRHLGQSPREFVDRFSQLMTRLKDMVAPPDSNLPVLAVVPHSLISLEDQLVLSGNRAFLKSADMHNVTPWEVEPTEPYALFDVSFGEDLRDLSPNAARKKLGKQGRHGLRLIELISLGIHSRRAFEATRGLYAVETVHQLDGDTTVVDFYRYGDSLKIKRDPGDINDPDWTTPSRAEVIIAA